MLTKGALVASFMVVAARGSRSPKLSVIMILVESPAVVRAEWKAPVKTSNCPAFQMAAS
jgi:hypothetical protein